MTPPPSSRTSKHIRHLGVRPKNDQDNSYREKLCHYVKDSGCFYELYPGSFYLVYMAKGETYNQLLMSAHEDATCPFIFWTTQDSPSLVYEPFHSDFGPLNLAVTHQFCSRVKIWMDTQAHRNPDRVPVIVLDDFDTEKKLNTTLLVAITAMIIFKLTDEEILQRLNFFMMYKGSPGEVSKQLVFREKKRFSDVSGYVSLMTLTLEDCIQAFYAALQLKFYDYYEFDQAEYLFYETVMSGDLNWIIPGKILAFAGPSDAKGWNKHKPSFYYHYFKDHNVSTVIRLNDPEYQADDFRQMGFEHYDLIFPDGYPPTSPIAEKFIKIVDEAKGAVAVHCYAGIGRTGTLIAAYLMARYNFAPQMAIAWTRICRPGSVIAEQQDWLYIKFAKCTFNKGANQRTKALTDRKIKATSAPDSPPQIATSDDVKTCPPTPVTRQQSKTSYAVAERKFGQAKALQLTKELRENPDRPCTRSQPAAITRNSTESDTSSAANNKEPMSAVTTSWNKRDIVLDLGRTVPITMELSDLIPLKGQSNPEHYRFKDGKYEFKIKFPPAGYVELRHYYKRDLKLTELNKLDCMYVNSELAIEFIYEHEDGRPYQGGAKETATTTATAGPLDVSQIPRLKPVVHYWLLPRA